jgi:hypothetical protein
MKKKEFIREENFLGFNEPELVEPLLCERGGSI